MATHAPPHSSTAPIAQLYSSSFTYSLNSPDPASLTTTQRNNNNQPQSQLAPPPPPPPPSSSKAPGFKSSRRTRAVSYVPLSPNVDFTLSPPLASSPGGSALPPHTAALVLTSPDPQRRVPTARRSIQFSKFGQLNWSRPIVPDEPVPAVPPLHPLQAAAAKLNGGGGSSQPPPPPTVTVSTPTPLVQIAARSRPNPAIDSVMRTTTPPQQSPTSLNSSDDEMPVTPPTTSALPAGAAPPEIQATKMWAVPQGQGLRGLGIAELEVPSIITTAPPNRPLSTSSSESAGSLAGESVSTASSSSSTSSQPVTPTRLQFATESFDKMSSPTWTLDELRSFRAAARELDLESKRLRRLRGREPSPPPRKLPRKKVPTVTDSEIKASAANSPRRRPAVRHSLIVAPTENIFSIAVAAPEPAPASDESDDDEPFPLKSSFLRQSGSPNMNAAATRRPFYAQGKAAMSAIDFSPRVSSPSNGAFPPFQKTPRNTSAAAVPTLNSIEPLKIEKRDKRATMMPPVRAPQQMMDAPMPMPTFNHQQQPSADSMPPSPDRTLSVKQSSGFLGKHKKLSRFLGKA
ncbi:uncharacterized protein LOC62_01G000840 [Vanrija pseudolonga]|uniref:Uncharacterized protein n=1 Tax=Vanrija pseudolonga TaxID=143232 RepID=A0AAF1BFC5_9TREE|nr:hypothetical protein LOC62_01G000840 [Vanrija pseudolonga]